MIVGLDIHDLVQDFFHPQYHQITSKRSFSNGVQNLQKDVPTLNRFPFTNLHKSQVWGCFPWELCLISAHAGASSDEAQEDQTVLDAQMKVADQVGLELAAHSICRRFQTINIDMIPAKTY